MALARHNGVVQDAAGNVVPFAWVEVRREGGNFSLVPLYTNRAGSALKGNPFQADANGEFGFHVRGGAYRVRSYLGDSLSPSFESTQGYVAVGTSGETDVDQLGQYLSAGIAPFATEADLLTFEPEPDAHVGGVVWNDPDPTKNGYYTTDDGGATWGRQRGLPDTFARLTVTGGTANALQVSSSPGVDPATVQVYFVDIATPNTTPATVSIDGGTALPITNVSDDPLDAGELQGRVLFTDEGDHYQLLTDNQAAAIAIAAAQEAIDAANDAIAAAASVNLPILTGGDTGKMLIVNGSETGYVLVTRPPTIPTPAGAGDIGKVLGLNGGGTTYALVAPGDTAYVNSFPKNLAVDGVTNDVAALIALEATAQEVIRLKNGDYYIGSNYTPTKTLRFSSGTKFIIPDGVTVDFSVMQPEIHAPKKQRFYPAGSGKVINLDVSWVGWFAGDLLDTNTDAHYYLQRWADSVSNGGLMKMTRNRVSSAGDFYIVCANRPRVLGTNRETSKIRFTGTATRGFQFTAAGGEGGHVQDIGFDRVNSLIAPTVGAAVLWQARRWTAQRVLTEGLYNGFNVQAPDGKWRDCDFFDTRSSCMTLDGINETQCSQSIMAANSSWITLTGVTGVFQNGEAFSLPGGTGPLLLTNGTNYKAISNFPALEVGDTITGLTSGATATVATIANGHNDGAVRIRNRCHATKLDHLEVSGGNYPLIIDGASADNADRSLSTKITACHFDSAKVGAAALFYACGVQFIACWFSSFDGVEQDVYLDGTDGVDFISCQWTFSNKRCVVATATSKRTNIIGGLIADTNASDVASIPAIRFDAGATGKVSKISMGQSYGYGPNHPKVGIEIGAGCGVVVDDVDLSAFPTPLINNSGGTAKIRHCPGYKTEAVGSLGVVFAGGGFGNWPHGLASTPAMYEARTEGDTTNEIQIISADATSIFGKLRSTTSGSGVDGTVTVKWHAKTGAAFT